MLYCHNTIYLQEIMGERNKHGLGRNIPAEVKRVVRKRCGFGCVRCGLALYDYEHFDPDFKDALSHDEKGITLLCMQCNQKRNRGVLSVETVREANLNPKCLSVGFASETFDFGTKSMTVIFAGYTFIDCNTLIAINDFPILSVQPPENSGEPYRLSGRFADETGEITLAIKDNVWIAGADSWDVECVGPRIIIKNGPRRVALKIKSEPPHRIIIEQLNMQFDGVTLRAENEKFEMSVDGKNWVSFTGGGALECNVGIDLRNR